jgi:hypothetical protein
MTLRKMKIKQLLFCLIILFITTGCAAIFNHSPKDVAFNSKPKGMEVFINDSLYGRTPLSVELNKKIDYNIKYKYLDSVVFFDSISSSTYIKYVLFDLFFPGNIPVLTIPFTFIFDGYSGYYKDLDKSYIYFNMLKSDSNEISNMNDEQSSEDFEKFVLRKNSYLWTIMLNNGNEFEKLKFIKIDKNMLEVTPEPFSENENFDNISLLNKNQKKILIPIDSIERITYIRDGTFNEWLANTIIGTVIGSAVGLGVAYALDPDDSHYNEMGRAIPALIALSCSLSGFIVGAFWGTGEYESYYLKNMNLEIRNKLINKKILLIDE